MPQKLTRPILQGIIAGLGYRTQMPYTTSSKGFYVYMKRSVMDRAMRLILDATKEYKPKEIRTHTLQIGDFVVSLQPEEAKRAPAGNAGGLAEKRFDYLLNEHIKELGGVATVEFIAGTKKFRVANVVKGKETGSEGTKANGVGTGKKADQMLVLKNGTTIPLSLKGKNGLQLASLDSVWLDSGNAKKLVMWAIKKGRTHLVEEGTPGIYKLQNAAALAVEASAAEVKFCAFGTDILPNGAIIHGDMDPHNFMVDTKTKVITIKCKNIYTSAKDFTGEHAVWILIRNDRSRNSEKLGRLFFKGLRILAVLFGNTRGANYIYKNERTAIGLKDL